MHFRNSEFLRFEKFKVEWLRSNFVDCFAEINRNWKINKKLEMEGIEQACRKYKLRR